MGPVLAKTFGVAYDTVRRANELLRERDLIVTGGQWWSGAGIRANGLILSAARMYQAVVPVCSDA